MQLRLAACVCAVLGFFALPSCGDLGKSLVLALPNASGKIFKYILNPLNLNSAGKISQLIVQCQNVGKGTLFANCDHSMFQVFDALYVNTLKRSQIKNEWS